MKRRTWLVLDCNFLCHRALHALGDLSFGAAKTGVVFGFLRDIRTLQEAFATSNIVFCFDYGVPRRLEVYPDYKKSRATKKKEYTAEERRAYREFRRQVAALRDEHLFRLGFRNVFFEDGLEADDIIASVCKYLLPFEDRCVIVSADKDLYQCLCDGRTSFYNPITKDHVTKKSFEEKYGIDPYYWFDVVAMTGCSTDEVTGIKGVGEKTAIKYLTGVLAPDSVAYKTIKAGKEIIARNRPLVRLPYMGTPVFDLVPDRTDSTRWRKLVTELGMRSLMRTPPLSCGGF